MQLPYAEHQTSASIEELINSVLSGEKSEVELAASLNFYEEVEDNEEGSSLDVSDSYHQYFKSVAAEISKLLGPAAFNGGLPEAFEWCDVLGIEAGFDEISVWVKGEQHIYLQFIWEDKDCPIVVSLGAS